MLQYKSCHTAHYVNVCVVVKYLLYLCVCVCVCVCVCTAVIDEGQQLCG